MAIFEDVMLEFFNEWKKLDNVKPSLGISDNSLGIPDNCYLYLSINEKQSRDLEYQKNDNFLKWVVQEHPEVFSDNTKLEFINYGDTELVYVVHDNNQKRVLLIGQPAIQFGTVKKEYDILQKLYQQNPSLIVSPTHYFKAEDKEAYLAPYFYQARCIATQNHGYGVYIPEPYYRFEKFNDDEEYLVNTAIVASMVSLYNEEENLGLAACKIGGGDFILEKDYDSEEHNIENTVKRLHLIAARELIDIELKDYIQLLRHELSKITYYRKQSERDKNILINYKNRYPMSSESIEDGIALGLKLRKY